MAGDEERRAQASLAHKALAAYEGDVPTLINIYERWSTHKGNEAGRRRWCMEHFVNGRAMARAHEVRGQLQLLLRKQGVDTDLSCSTGEELGREGGRERGRGGSRLVKGREHAGLAGSLTQIHCWWGAGVGAERQVLLRCLAVGLFLNVAHRQPPSQGRRGCYKVVSTGR